MFGVHVAYKKNFMAAMRICLTKYQRILLIVIFDSWTAGLLVFFDKKRLVFVLHPAFSAQAHVAQSSRAFALGKQRSPVRLWSWAIASLG